MKPKDYRYNGKAPLALSQAPTGADGKVRAMKDELVQRTEENMEQVARLQERLYAGGREGLVIVLQAMDAAGKDSTIKHVMAGINPQGVRVYSFKQPSAQELSHDYLWRIVKCLPARGQITIFNRSHYEDVLAVEVLKLYESFKMPQRCLTEDSIPRRLKQIAQFEEYLYDNSYRVVKIFLHLSREEQRERFLARIENPAKNWKFSLSDVTERAHFDEYLDLYEKVINATATPESPWYALPADQKWYTRYLVSEILLDALGRCCHEYPRPAPSALAELKDCRDRLKAED